MAVDKTNRILMMFTDLTRGKTINKTEVSKKYKVSERSIERDLEDIRNFLAEIHSNGEVLFDKDGGTYYLSNWEDHKFTGTEVIVLLKILIGTRALRKEEMESISKSIRLMLDPTEKKETLHAILNEVENYVSPVHNKNILQLIEDLNKVIIRKVKIKLNYTKANGVVVNRTVLPLAFVFSDFYFYLIAFIDGTEYNYPAFFRIDRIDSFTDTKERYDDKLYLKYNTGSMRNCLQFMYAGELLTVKIKCKNCAVEILKDRLPNHLLLEDKGDYKIFSVKIFGNGFIIWALSQGDNIEILEPQKLREKIMSKIQKLNQIYFNDTDKN